MVLLHPGDVRIVRWIARIYDLNSIAAGGALLCFMVMFGLLTDAVGGLMFPLALPSMALEGSPWGIWMLSPLYLLPVRLLAGRVLADRERTAT